MRQQVLAETRVRQVLAGTPVPNGAQQERAQRIGDWGPGRQARLKFTEMVGAHALIVVVTAR